MTQVSASALKRARRFVETAGRPLDVALLDYLAPADGRIGSAARVVEELSRFQTPDGGFGRGLEPDLRTPSPTAIATSVAFLVLRDVAADASLPIVRNGIDYLLRTLDRETWVWPIVTATIDDDVHAPWWNVDGIDARFGGFVFNPSAELLGYLYDYRAGVPGDIVAAIESTILAALAERDAVAGPYDLHCLMRLFRSAALPDRVADRLRPILLKSLEAADPDDPHLDFLALAPTPTSFGHEAARVGVARRLERLAATQAEDGGWHPFWSWSETDAAAWAEAEREWSSVLTTRAIIGLSSHGAVAD